VRRVKLAPGLGLAWRQETAWLIQCRGDLVFSEVIAENVDSRTPPGPLTLLLERGATLIPHGVSLSLGGAEALDLTRVEHLAALASTLKAPFVSEHIAFVRAGGLDSGHLLPVPRTPQALGVLIENVKLAMARLPVPLVLENIATLFEWPENELGEVEFLRTLFQETGARWLLDASNLYANAINHGWNLDAFLDRAPLERVAYIHVAGGTFMCGLYHDTHAHPLTEGPLAVLGRILERTGPLPVLLERDRDHGSRSELEAELDAVKGILAAAGHSAAEPRPHAS
jgi:uncharacterized protein (UPF0276 family)